jgi:hypothetical protein
MSEQKQNNDSEHVGAGEEGANENNGLFSFLPKGGKKRKTSKRKNGGKNKTSKRKTSGGNTDALKNLMDMMQGGKQKRRAAANVIDKLIGGNAEMLNKLKNML